MKKFIAQLFVSFLISTNLFADVYNCDPNYTAENEWVITINFADRATKTDMIKALKLINSFGFTNKLEASTMDISVSYVIKFHPELFATEEAAKTRRDLVLSGFEKLGKIENGFMFDCNIIRHNPSMGIRN